MGVPWKGRGKRMDEAIDIVRGLMIRKFSFDIPRVLVRAQAFEAGLPQLVSFCPLSKLDFSDQFGLKPENPLVFPKSKLLF